MSALHATSALTLSIVSHGHGPMLARLLDDLSRLGSLAGSKVIVTLNQPGEAFDAASWPNLDIAVLRNRASRGFGANHNSAFAHCHTPWFVVLNPDLRLPKDPFPALLQEAGSRADLGVIAPRIIDSTGDREDSVRANLTPWSLLQRVVNRKAGGVDVSDGAPREIGFYWLAGMFMLFSARAFRQVGGFDERFFLYCEDYDICARLWRAGFVLGVGQDSVAVHDAQRNSRRSIRYLAMHATSLLKVWTSAAFWRVTLRNKHVSATS